MSVEQDVVSLKPRYASFLETAIEPTNYRDRVRFSASSSALTLFKVDQMITRNAHRLVVNLNDIRHYQEENKYVAMFVRIFILIFSVEMRYPLSRL